MGNKVKHFFIACAEVDALDCRILMNGMGVHSDFLNWHLNDFYEEAKMASAVNEGGVGPDLKMWHGFAPPDFMWEVMATLILSVNWQAEHKLQIMVEVEGALVMYGARDFFHAVREGKLK